jgi:hypothetical protein
VHDEYVEAFRHRRVWGTRSVSALKLVFGCAVGNGVSMAMPVVRAIKITDGPWIEVVDGKTVS